MTACSRESCYLPIGRKKIVLAPLVGAKICRGLKIGTFRRITQILVRRDVGNEIILSRVLL